MDKELLIEALNQESKKHYALWREAQTESTESAIELALGDAFESLAEGLKS